MKIGNDVSFRRAIIEAGISICSSIAPRLFTRPTRPRSIFVLRNNDIGDLLIVTPVFEALKRIFPQARVIAGVGTWNQAVLQNNPWVDLVLPINAPWHNKQVSKIPHNSSQGFFNSMRYIYTSAEVRQLKEIRCDVGIDLLGSPEGSILMIRAGIPWRLGVKGYAGGHTACQQTINFDEDIQVGRAALKFSELLGATQIPRNHPQLFLTPVELSLAAKTWSECVASGRKRILLAPGGGFSEKCWPREHYQKLAAQLASHPDVCLMIVGGPSDHELGEFVKGASAEITNLCGKTSLRETFALIAAADGVICNSSMVLHAAAAFDKFTVVLLGQTFKSARKHKQLWGYDNNDLHIGREPAGETIPVPEEVLPIMLSHFKLK